MKKRGSPPAAVERWWKRPIAATAAPDTADPRDRILPIAGAPATPRAIARVRMNPCPEDVLMLVPMDAPRTWCLPIANPRATPRDVPRTFARPVATPSATPTAFARTWIQPYDGGAPGKKAAPTAELLKWILPVAEFPPTPAAADRA